MRRSLLLAALTALLAAPVAEASVRFATFNASLNRNAEGQLRSDLSTGANAQARAVAEIVQRTRPDVLLINEFDFDPVAVDLFRDNYLEVSQNGAAPIQYPFSYIAESNTGIPSGHNLDNSRDSDGNETIGGPNDAFGFGSFPGQFGMVVYSRYPIDPLGVRTFQTFLWKDMPGNLLPTPWYSPEEVAIFRLSSKSHWDVPVVIGGKRVHFLTAHPTPPVFDEFAGAVDFNGRRNHDEIRFWADYVMPGRGGYIYDDADRAGGLKPGEPFVIAGDYNSDPFDGDSIPGSAQLLLAHPLVNTKTTPSSLGGPWATRVQDVLNLTHRGDPAVDTADFCDFPAFPPCSGPGNLRVDYVLPRKNLRIVDAGVFWPSADPTDADPLAPFAYLTDPTGFGFPAPSSDHRLVWVDVEVPGRG
jgi:Endonuclease/Exonuclease/phosphatase family